MAKHPVPAALVLSGTSLHPYTMHVRRNFKDISNGTVTLRILLQKFNEKLNGIR